MWPALGLVGPVSVNCGWVRWQVWSATSFKVWRQVKLSQQIRACLALDRLVGLVVRRPPREWKVPGSYPACAGIFSGSSHTSDLNIGTPVATLPGAFRYRVSTGTGRPGVSILWLGEMESFICSFYLSMAARKIVWADPSLRYTSMLLGHYIKQPTNNNSLALARCWDVK